MFYKFWTPQKLKVLVYNGVFLKESDLGSRVLSIRNIMNAHRMVPNIPVTNMLPNEVDDQESWLKPY